eukprot:TRINITY_DN8119_c0_g1_i1.p1 TRINITY_DN8119_c0_g1~~TRINITY_DN8119_c0_g1_i1.p1  ORF type:complete len:395 (-),score=104.89 TRINITY_DN8119_c0_g1_i1:40-1224(-)
MAEKSKWAFWSTQPVPQKAEDAKAIEGSGKAIDVEKDPVKDIRQEPLPLPALFEWYSVNIDNESELTDVYQLLRDHYVEDDDNMFRFDYSREFLLWALKPPGFLREWHLAVRFKDSKQLVGFISAIPASIYVHGTNIKMVEINFLCVHNKLRSMRLAPVLIREITRRVNVTGIFQAAYTAGITLPTPIASCQYYHRSLNPKKLIDVKFSYLKKNMTMARTIKLYQLDDKFSTPGLRPLTKEDCPSACELLNNYLKKFKLHMHFSEEDFVHWFMPVKGVVDCYVVSDPKTKKVTDMISFYHLPSSILNNPKYNKLNAAYSWYNVATTVDLVKLMNDSLIAAKKEGFDVFNCLAIHDNENFLKELKFGPGDGHLQYYLYNWLAPSMESSEVGLVLL